MSNYRVVYHDGMDDGESLAHFGIKGMKWGVRRYQNPDGSLTPEGMKRYGIDSQGNIYRKGRRYKKTLEEAKKYGDAVAKAQKIERDITAAAKKAGAKEGDYIQLSPEINQEYRKTTDLINKLSAKYNKKKLKGDQYIKTMDDGKDYVATIMKMKHSKAYVEYYSLIGESEKKKK